VDYKIILQLMSKLLKLLKSLSKKGFATISEKAEVQALYKELEADDKEVVAEEVSDVENLPEADPKEEEAVTEAVEKAFSKTADKVEKSISTKLDASVKSIKDEVEAWLTKQKESMATKSGAYNEDVVAKKAKMNTYLKAFAGAILSGDDAMAKEMTTDKTGTPFAGYAVDSELSAEIRHLTTQYGVARREFFTTALSKNSYEANALATDVTVTWVSETGVIPSTQVVLNQEELKLKKLGAIVTLTRELIEDQEVDLFSFIATRVAEGFARAEDKAFFTGAGTGDTANGEFEGLLENSDLDDVSLTGALSTLSVEKIYEMIDALPEGAQANAKFYAHRSILSRIRTLVDGDGRYIYQNPLNESGSATLAGYPFVSVEVMPKATDVSTGDAFMIFGDLKKTAILGYKNGLNADRFNAGVVRNVAGNGDINLITSDREAIRWVTRVGYITILPSASIVMKTQAGS
jgi:HK97 family phage major capsid protein